MQITKDEREAVYKTIFSRRDVRKEFKSDEIEDDILMRVIKAAHHAPSVGFMQPWDFVVVKSVDVKQQIKEAFEQAHFKEGQLFDGERRKQYKTLKLEGIIEAPIGICVTCDRSRSGSVVLGRTSNPDMDLYSTVCAIQNMWLATRAENLGMGWVSIINYTTLQDILKIPRHIVPVAYLCIGYVSDFADKPMLETAGWRSRQNLDDLIHYEYWSEKPMRNADE